MCLCGWKWQGFTKERFLLGEAGPQTFKSFHEMLLRKSAAWVNPSDDEDFRSFGDSLYKVRKIPISENFVNRLSHPVPILEITKVIPYHGQPPRLYHD